MWRKIDDFIVLYINLLTEPTFGGITASFGTLGDIIIAEQGARIGFAGRRVIEQTIRQKLPDDFQTAEYLLKYSYVENWNTEVHEKYLDVDWVNIKYFETKEVEAREGRNPKTGEAIKIDAHKKAHFTSAQALKDHINE